MKKFKLLNILLILAVVLSVPTVYAYDTKGITIDRDNIKIENIDNNIYSGSKIKLDEALTNDLGEYKLYYQYVEVSNDIYQKYMAKHNEEKKYEEELLKSEGVSSVDELSTAVKKEYTEAINSFEEEKAEVLPTYNNSKWVEATDNKAPLDLTKVPQNELGEQAYVLWIKVEPKSSGKKSVFNALLVKTKAEVPADTEKDEENAKTSDNIVMVGIGAVLLFGVIAVSYRKAKD